MKTPFAMAVLFVSLVGAAEAQQSTEFSATTRRPVTSVREEQVEQTVLVPKTRTVTQQVPRVVWQQVTQQHYEAVRTNPWNVFAQPQYQWRLVTTAAWQPRQETVSVPITYQELVPEKKMVSVSRRVLGFEDDVQLTRVVTSAPPAAAPQSMVAGAPVFRPSSMPTLLGPAAQMARQPQYGGVSRLQTDPPRYGPGVARY